MLELTMTPAEAVEAQKRLKEHVRLEPLASPPKVLGGCDVSMSMFAKDGFAGFVSLSYPSLELIDHAVIKGRIPFPYIPGLLSFREIPMLMNAWEKLETKPDILVVDGTGIAHPRRLGIASHLGLMLDLPTIGCAKSVLIGRYEEPENEPGATSPLIDPKTNDIVGAALRTKKNVKPVFISPGHRITLLEAVDLVRRCVRFHRIPEPTRLAHTVVNEYRVRD
jgi:deoxyribonuclease V